MYWALLSGFLAFLVMATALDIEWDANPPLEYHDGYVGHLWCHPSYSLPLCALLTELVVVL